MEQLRAQTGGATGGVDLSNGNATEVPPTTKVTEERARESGERESFNVLNLLDSNFMCGKCDTKNGEKDPKSDARILETHFLTKTSSSSENTPEVKEVVDNDADELERTGPRHGQPEIDTENSGSPEGGGEASAGRGKKHHNDGLESNHTIMGAICECADKTEALSQQFVEQLDHKGDLVVTRLTAPLPDEQRRAIIGHSIRKKVVRRELSTFEQTTAGGATEKECRERSWVAEFDRRERVQAMMGRAGVVPLRPITAVCDTPAERADEATTTPYEGRNNPFYLPEKRLTLERVLWRPGQSKRRRPSLRTGFGEHRRQRSPPWAYPSVTVRTIPLG